MVSESRRVPRDRVAWSTRGVMVAVMSEGESAERRLLLAGVAAPAVWLLGALSVSLLEQDFMARLGWDVWPSGLALGPIGAAQVCVFLVFSLLLVRHATALARLDLSRPGRLGARILLAGAGVSVCLAFLTDPPGDAMTWHGALHAVGYVAMMLGVLVSLVLVLPGAARRARSADWRRAALAVVLIVPAWAMPTATGRSGYLFFAVPFTALAMQALLLSRVRPGR